MSHAARAVGRVSLLAASVLVALTPSAASAQEDPHRLEWSEDWSRVHPAAYGAAGMAMGVSLLFGGIYDGGTEASLRGGNVVDTPVREALMAPTDEGRRIASRVSDVLLLTLVAWPVVVDAVAVAGLADLDSDVFWQLTSIAWQSYAIELLVNTVLKELFARERPRGSRCTLEDRRLDPDRCGPGARMRSFYSGHTSFAFTAAGLMCVNHAHLPLYGSDVADGIACGTSLLLAATVGALRIVADRHYLTDTLVGAVMGFASGFLVPFLLQYQSDPTPDASVAASSAPLSAPVMAGLGGRF